jgi:hypothetical protein
LVPLQERLQCSEIEIEKKKIEINATTSSGACQTIVDDEMISFLKSTGELPYLEKQIEIRMIIIGLFSSKVEEGEVELEATTKEFQKFKKDLQFLTHRVSSSKVWIDGLVHQIQLMAHRNGIINTPLPIENPKNMLVAQFGNFWVTPCPIYGLFYACNNILVSSCGCTYHHFCMDVHLETKAFCANPTCGKVLLSKEWITSVGFNHISIKFKRPKLEMPNPRSIRFAQFDLQQKNWSQVVCCYTISFRPIEVLTI